MQSFQVIRINPKVETITKKKPLFDQYGQLSGKTEDVTTSYQLVQVTDGSRFEGVLTEFSWAAPVNAVDVGDIVSGYPDNNGYLLSVNIERGRNAIMPASPEPKAAPQPLPEVQAPQEEPWRFAVASGYAATPADIAAFANAFFSLERAFKKYVTEHP
jgi:hypothetical protein